MITLPADWRLVPVEELRAPDPGAIAIGPFGSSMKADLYVPGGVPVIRGQNLGDTPSFVDDFVFVTEDTANRLANARVREGDLVFPHRGAIGRVGIVPAEPAGGYLLSTSLMKLTCDRSVADARFLYQWFRSGIGRAEILRFASTVGTPGIGQPTTSLRRMRVPLPPLNEQVVIADLLGALDDKIESNRRLATAVDGLLRAEVAATSADGEAATIAELVTYEREVVAPEDVTHGTRYLGLEHMPRGSTILDAWGSADGLASAKSVFGPGDILFGKLRPYFKKVGLAPPTGGICSTDIMVLRPIREAVLPVALAVLASDDFITFASNAASGTRMPRATWDHMKSFVIIVPSDEKIEQLAETLLPLLEAARRAIEQNVVLADLRETLLPELLAGRLRAEPARELVGSSAP
jgi:type I restriction enzyme S subunit